MIPAWLTGRAALMLGTAVLASAASWWVRGTMADADLAKMARAHAEQVEEWSTAATKAAKNEIERSNRRAAALEAARDEAIKLSGSARADAARASADSARLRNQLDAIRRDALSRDPSLANGSPAGASTAAVLAYMLGRSIDRAKFLAGFADRARIAGLTCERAYDGIRAP